MNLRGKEAINVLTGVAPAVFFARGSWADDPAFSGRD